MRRAYLFPAVFAALIGATAYPVLAQDRVAPAPTASRPIPDLSTLEQRLRDRGLAEDQIGIQTARIRAAIASGQYPHLERRLFNALNPDTGDGANRRRFAERSERPDGVGRPEVERPDVSRADDVRPASDRPANVVRAPGIARRQ